jgi:hypothetical protein
MNKLNGYHVCYFVEGVSKVGNEKYGKKMGGILYVQLKNCDKNLSTIENVFNLK